MIEKLALWVGPRSASLLKKSQDATDSTIPWDRGTIITTDQKPEVIQAQDRVSDTFAELVKIYLHAVGVGLGFSYTLLTRDIEKVSYASTRYTKINDSGFFHPLTKWFANSGYCRPLWAEFVKYEAMTGRIPISFAEYTRNPWGYTEAYWLPEGEDWVDPLDDVNATVIEYTNGMKTLQEIYAERGKDWVSAINQIADEREYLKEKGLESLIPVPKYGAEKKDEKETADVKEK